MRIASTTSAFLSFVLAANLAASLAAQAPAPATALAPATAVKPAARPGSFVMEAGDHRTAELVDRAAQFLGRNILFCEQEAASCGPGGGTLRLQQRVEVDAGGCEELLCSLLYVRGLAVVPIDEGKGMYEVIAMAGQRGREVTMRAPMRTVEDVLARPQLRMMVTTPVTLQHINANIATNAMRPFFAQAGGSNGGGNLTLGTGGSNNGLLISGFQDQVATLVKLVQTLDAAAAKEKQQTDDKVAELERRIAALEARLGDKK